MNLTLRTKRKTTGVRRDSQRKGSSNKWRYTFESTSFDDNQHSFEVVYSTSNGNSWDRIEEFCWLHIGKPDAWGRHLKSKIICKGAFHGIGMSQPDALTDEDEYLLEFATEDEKEELISSIKLMSEYKIKEEIE